MQKKTVISVIIIAMLLTIALYFIGSTYARYAVEYTGESTVNIAKWAVQVNGKDGSDDTNLALNFEVEGNDNVVDEKIAPSVKASAPINVVLDGTEVAVDLIVEEGDNFESALNTLGINNKQIKFSVKQDPDNSSNFATTPVTGDGSSGQPFKIPLQEGAAFGPSHIFKVEVTVQWDNEETNNTEDTTIGRTKTNFKLPVKLKVQQHIDPVV